MSAKRRADIDAIQTALTSGTDVPENTNPGTFLPSGPGAGAVPDEPATLTPEQKEANKLLKDAEVEQLKLQKEQESLIKAQTQRTIQSTKQAIGSLQNGIGSVAIPGGLLLPLVVLGIFLMLLVKMNGNTRLGWLWLVMTGNAAVFDPNSNGASGDFGSPGVGDNNSSIPGANGASGNFGGGPPPKMYYPALPLELDEW